MTLHQPVQRGPVDARDAGGLRHVAAGPVDEPGQVLPFELRNDAVSRGVIALFEQGRDQRRGIRARVRCPGVSGEMQVFGSDLGARFHDDGDMLDHVLQLAHVAAPGVAAQRAQRRVGQAREGRALAAMAHPIGGQEVVR